MVVPLEYALQFFLWSFLVFFCFLFLTQACMWFTSKTPYVLVES